MKPKLSEYLMSHGVLKGADAQVMAQEIVDMLGVEKLIERNHELEQKELVRSASRPAEAEAMRNVLEESRRQREQLDAAEKACAAVRQYSQKVSAVGYKEGVVGSDVQMLLGEHGKGWHSPEEWDGLQKANAELREFALSHFSREQVRPLVNEIKNILEWIESAEKEWLESIDLMHGKQCCEEALAHARAVGMEDKT